jgi:hypothetical protein
MNYYDEKKNSMYLMVLFKPTSYENFIIAPLQNILELLKQSIPLNNFTDDQE